MLYCYDTKLNFEYTESEMAISKMHGNIILYDSDKKEFIDLSGNIININGKIIFPKTGSTQIFEMNDEILKKGGIPVISNEEIIKIDRWPEYYQTKRKMRVLKGKDFINENIIQELKNTFKNPIFIKTVEKNFNGIIDLSLLSDKECNFYKALLYHLEDDFIISDKVNIVSDKYGKREYRCFILNNEIYNISRMTTHVFHSIEKEILEILEDVVSKTKDYFSGFYEVDLIVYEENGEYVVDVSEFNPIHASGIYLYNSAIEKSSDLLHEDIYHVAREFEPLKDKCVLDGKVIDNRDSNFNDPNSFANDLMSICTVGRRGAFISKCIINESDYAKHEGRLNPANLVPVTDELFSKSFEETLEKEKASMTEEELKMHEDIEKLLKKMKG